MTQATDCEPLDNNVLNVRTAIDTFLTKHIQALPNHPTKLVEAMEYSLLGGGKRMRPLLCFLIGESLGLKENDTTVIGGAIECIHAYSLIHDDLPAMDDDDTRRGRPTCHRVYGEAVAILAGDALQSLAFTLLSNLEWLPEQADKKIALIQELAIASGSQGMCGGQAIDLAATGSQADLNHSIETLNLLHNLKTGALLKACVTMPLAICDNLPTNHRVLFEQFADNIGLAFQVQDDILDIEGSAEQIGKPQGSDAAQDKLTYPALLGLEGAKQQLSKLVDAALQALAALPYNTQALVAFCDLMIHRDH